MAMGVHERGDVHDHHLTAVAVAASCELADALPWHVWHTQGLALVSW